jgi:hypothetical protein
MNSIESQMAKAMHLQMQTQPVKHSLRQLALEQCWWFHFLRLNPEQLSLTKWLD